MCMKCKFKNKELLQTIKNRKMVRDMLKMYNLKDRSRGAGKSEPKQQRRQQQNLEYSHCCCVGFTLAPAMTSLSLIFNMTVFLFLTV